MSLTVVPIKQAPRDLAEHLRAMADLVETNEITDAVIAYHHNGNRCFSYGGSLNDCLVLSDLLHQNCLDRMRA